MLPATRPRTVVVTGAAGFIGSHTIDRFLSAGHRVIGIDDLSSGCTANLTGAFNHSGFELLVQDVARPGFLESVCGGRRVDAIVHLAGLASVGRAEDEPDLNFRLNVGGTQAVAEAARRGGVPRVVFASSATVYGDAPEPPLVESQSPKPLSAHGNAKLISELLLEQYGRSCGLTVVCNRCFNVFGPRQNGSSSDGGAIAQFVERLSHGLAPVVFGDGFQSRDFISVYDVAAANVLAATGESVAGGVYNVCTGVSRSLLEVIEVLSREFPGARAAQFAEERPGDLRHSLGCPRRAERLLGFTAKIDFHDAVAELVSAGRTASRSRAV